MMDSAAELQRLQAQITAMTLGQSTAPPPAEKPVTADQVAAIVDAAITRAMPQLIGMVQVIDEFFSKALPPEELEAFKAYRDAGAPGLRELLASENLHPVAQLLWDEIKNTQVK